MTIRIEATGEIYGGTKVFDVDTGEEIKNVKSVTYKHEAGHIPVVTLEIVGLEGINVCAEGILERPRGWVPPEARLLPVRNDRELKGVLGAKELEASS